MSIAFTGLVQLADGQALDFLELASRGRRDSLQSSTPWQENGSYEARFRLHSGYIQPKERGNAMFYIANYVFIYW